MADKAEKEQYLVILQENLRRIRKQRGLTQTEAGERAGMPQNQFSHLEVADFDPRISAIYRVSQALEVPLYELFRDPSLDDASVQEVLQRVMEMEATEREPLMKIIEAYLQQYRAKHGYDTPTRERMKELKEVRESTSKND